MSVSLFVLGIALFALFGAFATRLDTVRRLDRGAQLALMLVCGFWVGGVVMWAYAVMGVPWRRWTLGIPLVIAALAWKRSGGQAILLVRSPWRRWDRQDCLSSTFFLAVFAYALATARATCGDLLYFWGPKSQRFWMTEGIDLPFLQFPHYFLMHRDYPPLQVFVFAFGALTAHKFVWWGAVFSALLFLAASIAVFRGFAKDNTQTALFAAVLTFAWTAARVAGGADPLLFLFEIVVIAALTFEPDDRGAQILAAIALAGAMFTKVEGTSFAIIVVIAYALTGRWRRALLLIVPGALLLGSWLAWCAQHELLDTYARKQTALHFDQLGTVLSEMLKSASYKSFFIPWIAILVAFALGRNFRRAAVPLLVAAGTLASLIYFYLHEPQPVWWVRTSADRVLITPLIALLIACARVARHGVVPEGKEAEGSGREAGRDPRGAVGQV